MVLWNNPVLCVWKNGSLFLSLLRNVYTSVYKKKIPGIQTDLIIIKKNRHLRLTLFYEFF